MTFITKTKELARKAVNFLAAPFRLDDAAGYRASLVAKETGLARSEKTGSVRMLSPAAWIRNEACPISATLRSRTSAGGLS